VKRDSVATTVAPATSRALEVSVFGVEWATAVGTFVEGGEAIQAVEDWCALGHLFRRCRFEHSSIVDAPAPRARDCSTQIRLPVRNRAKSSLRPGTRKNFGNERRLERDVTVHISLAEHGVLALEGAVAIPRPEIVDEGVAKEPVIAVGSVIEDDEVEVVRRECWFTGCIERLTAFDVEVTDPAVARRVKKGDRRCDLTFVGHDHVDVNNGFRAESRYGRRANVFNPHDCLTDERCDVVADLVKPFRPVGVGLVDHRSKTHPKLTLFEARWTINAVQGATDRCGSEFDRAPGSERLLH